VFEAWKAVQHLHKVGWAELRRSTSGGNLLGQSHQLGLLPGGYFCHS
jgi:hypothetical protein